MLICLRAAYLRERKLFFGSRDSRGVNKNT